MSLYQNGLYQKWTLSSRQSISKDIVGLNNITNHLDKKDTDKLLPALPKTHLSKAHAEDSSRQTTKNRNHTMSALRPQSGLRL